MMNTAPHKPSLAFSLFIPRLSKKPRFRTVCASIPKSWQAAKLKSLKFTKLIKTVLDETVKLWKIDPGAELGLTQVD